MQSQEEEKKQNKYEDFVTSLKQKIKIDESAYLQYKTKVNSISALESYIEVHSKVPTAVPMKIDIGNGVFVESKRINSKIILNIGLDYFVEVSYEEAKPLLARQKKLYETKISFLQKEIIKNKAYMKLTKDLSNQLSMVTKENEKTEVKNLTDKVNTINI